MVEKKFLKAIKDFNLFQKGDSVLIAFSGGVDSTVLATLLIKFKDYLGIDRISLAHMNHSLREEADRDQEFCENFAKEKNIEIYTQKINVKKFAEANSMSIEEASRVLRYKFLKEIAEKKDFTKIATGHHLSDLIETMILWFIQGNVKGIKGFRVKENNIVRPLYYLTKEEIQNYASQEKIRYVVDKSNFETAFLRNKIRHYIIPKLKEINPSLEKSMLIEALFIQLDDAFLSKKSEEVSQKFLNKKIKLDKIKKLPKSILYRAIADWIYRETGTYPSYKKLLEILKVLEKAGEKRISLNKNYELIKSYTELIILPKRKTKKFEYKIKPGEEIYIKEAGVIIKSYTREFSNMEILKKDEKKFVCFDIREENPEFIIRSRKPGDRFLPFGKHSEKKLKDIMIELKIPQYMRDTIPILEFRNKILWLIGYKRSGYYPISDKTKKMICFEIKEV